MKIKVPQNAVCGQVPIIPGEYWVSLNAECGEMTLSARGQDIRVKATKRRSVTHAKITTIQFYSGGGKQWSLVVVTPKQGEWVAFIDYV